MPEEPSITPRGCVTTLSGAFVLVGLGVLALVVSVGEGAAQVVPGAAFGLALAGAGLVLRRVLLRRVATVAARRAAGEHDLEDPFTAELGASGRALRAAHAAGAATPRPLRLAPDTRRLGPVLVSGLVAAGWNTVVVGLLAAGELTTGERGLALVLLVVGLVLLLWFARNLLVLTNPRVSFELEHGRLSPGTRSALRWRVSGHGRRLEDLRIALVELRLARVGSLRGGHGALEVTELRRVPLFESDHPPDLAEGRCELSVPDDAARSERGAHAERRWSLVAEGRVPLGPDLREEFVLWVQ